MTRCARPLDELLEADLGVLAGEGESELASHIRTCERCGSAAGTILNATTRLDAALAEEGPPPDVDAILARARLEATDIRFAPGRVPAKRWIALAAAAVAALMVIGRREPIPVASAPPRAPAPPLVEPSDGADVAVIRTDNPDITILWFFQGDRGR